MNKLEVFGLGIVSILQGLVMVLTLGFVWPEWEVNYIQWALSNMLFRAKEKNDK